jgi:hypothetical protein
MMMTDDGSYLFNAFYRALSEIWNMSDVVVVSGNCQRKVQWLAEGD